MIDIVNVWYCSVCGDELDSPDNICWYCESTKICEELERLQQRVEELEKENARLRIEEMAATMNGLGDLEILQEQNNELRGLIPSLAVRKEIHHMLTMWEGVHIATAKWLERVDRHERITKKTT